MVIIEILMENQLDKLLNYQVRVVKNLEYSTTAVTEIGLMKAIFIEPNFLQLGHILQ